MNERTGLLSQYRGLRKEIYILCFGRTVTSLGSMVWPMLTMILSQKMGLEASSIAVLMAVSTCIIMPANLLGGRLADRCSKKTIIVWCDCISVASYIACALLPIIQGEYFAFFGHRYLTSVFNFFNFVVFKPLF